MAAGLVIAGVTLSSCGADEPVLEEDVVDSRAAQQAAGGAPEGVDIGSISGLGPGCPPNDPDDIRYDIAEPDRTILALSFLRMTLEHPPGSTYQRIQCVVTITPRVPQGWQYGLTAVDMHGYARLPARTWGRQRSSYNFTGVLLGRFQRVIEGPHDDSFSFLDGFPRELVVWSPCGEETPFTIHTAVELYTEDNPTAYAAFPLGEFAGALGTNVHWTWRRC